MPTMKIGSRASQPPGRSANASAVKLAMQRSTVRLMLVGAIRLSSSGAGRWPSHNERRPRRYGRRRASPCRARSRDGSGPRRSSSGAFRPACIAAMSACVELDGLEVGEAPPRLAKRRLDRDRLAIGGDALRLPADRLQHVAIAEPHSGLVGRPRQHRLVQPDRLARNRRAARASRPSGSNVRCRRARRRRSRRAAPALPPAGPCGRGPARGSLSPRSNPGAISTARRSRFSASRQRPIRAGQLGQHADRRGVERVFLEVRLEQPLGDVEPVLVQAPSPPRSGAGANAGRG